MAKFEVGDRVAYRKNREATGTVIAISGETPSGTSVSVAWDYGVNGEIADSELVPVIDIGLS
jgi:hypothetical protein